MNYLTLDLEATTLNDKEKQNESEARNQLNLLNSRFQPRTEPDWMDGAEYWTD